MEAILKREKKVMKAQRWWQKLNGKMATLNLNATWDQLIMKKGHCRDEYLRLEKERWLSEHMDKQWFSTPAR